MSYQYPKGKNVLYNGKNYIIFQQLLYNGYPAYNLKNTGNIYDSC